MGRLKLLATINNKKQTTMIGLTLLSRTEVSIQKEKKVRSMFTLR